VVHAKDEAHLDALLGEGGCVVLFYAPWCGHCAAMKPEYEKAARSHEACLYVMVDCENAVGHATLQKHGIEAFPTVRHYRAGGTMTAQYEGAREEGPMVEWATKQQGK
jgi:protein disulfide-isomerase A1